MTRGVHDVMLFLPKDYGYVIGVAVGSMFVNQWMGFRVAKARKEFDIKYPVMYSNDNMQFNCIQRAHQNTLEAHPNFVTLLFISGLRYPRASAGLGALYCLGRIAFALGYYTGEPKNRRWGAFGYFGVIGLLSGTLYFAYQCLTEE